MIAEEFKKQFTRLGKNTEKYRTFIVTIEKEVTRIDKNWEEITKIISYTLYLTYYNLLIAQDSCQAHYQILSIIFLKEFIELNVNSGMTIKNVRIVELSIMTAFLNTQSLKMV